MKIKRFNESLITSGLENGLPKRLELYTHTGNFNYLLINVFNDGHLIKGIYHKQYKVSDEGLIENESDRLTLLFNFHTENGKLKILGQVLHGGSLKYEYSILNPDILRLISYDGFGSRMDSDTKFGFGDDTVQSLTRFINSFGFRLSIDNFKFLDKYSCSYQHWESLKISHIFGGTILVLDNGEPNRRNFVLNISRYLRQRGVNHILTSSVAEMKSILQTENIVGIISAGGNYRVSNPWGTDEEDLSHTSLKIINKPMIGMCFAYQSMANFYGAKVKDSGKYFMDNIKLTYWDKESLIFQNINLDDCQFSVDFHDIVTECPKGFKVIAKYKDNIFGIENKKLMRWGLAFHPEDIERTFPILDNFLEICREGHNNSRGTEVIKELHQFYKTSGTENVKKIPHRGDSILPGNNISYFQQDWFEKIMPRELEIYSSPLLSKLNTDGTVTELNTKDEKKIILLSKSSCSINSDLIQFSYCDDSEFEQSEVIDNGEPDGLAFDIFFVKNERGIKMNVDITYGEHMAYEFTLEAPNKINVVHYTGVGSLYDPETHWGFTESAIDKLVEFFNRFNHGIKISVKDLKFLDSNEQSYIHDKYDKKHLYTDDSNLIDFGNSSKESKIYNFKNWNSLKK